MRNSVPGRCAIGHAGSPIGCFRQREKLLNMYHCSPSWLEPGSIIRPGNYGRILKMIGANHTHWLREQFLELIRTQEFPDKPSRLTSAFTCEHLNAIRWFRESNCAMGVVYEVELVNPDANRHTTDFNLIQPIPGEVDDMCDISRRYWRASHWITIEGRPELRCAETLMETGLKVVREVELT